MPSESVAVVPRRGEQRAPERERLLRVDDLHVGVPLHGGGRGEAVRGVSFEVGRGEAVGLVGESGSGKTLTCRAVLGVLPGGVEITRGGISFGERRLDRLTRRQWEDVRGRRIGAIFQDPTSFLNPSLTVGSQLAEVLRVKGGLERGDARRRAVELLDLMGIHHPEYVYDQVPAQLSGGMLQRVMIAIAVSCDPELVVADEATTALDVTTEREVIDLLRALRHRIGISVLMVSHDLPVVAELCDRIVVFYAGEVVEEGPVEQIVSQPRHPYTRALLRAASLGDGDHRSLDVIPGQPPSVGARIPGCRFAGRCDHAIDACTATPVALRRLDAERSARCVRAEELARPEEAVA
ncbi:MAG: ABC transporter ATP-binding protein [Actinomycetota bacterium]|nr:ABC transporter ATP-binding protein [Actinomycetota bacterium]